MSECVYKVRWQYKNKMDRLQKYGFYKYEVENDEDALYAKKIMLGENTSIFKMIKNTMEKYYANASKKEREKDFKDYVFYEVEPGKYELSLTDELRKEFGECQLCIYAGGLGAFCLFINSPVKIEYFNSIVLDECCKDIIETMLNDKVIIKTKAPI